MATVITNYTTPDMAYYYSDLAQLPRTYDEECQQLLAHAANMPHLDTQTRNRLIEGHLSLATHIAIKRCPPLTTSRSLILSGRSLLRWSIS